MAAASDRGTRVRVAAVADLHFRPKRLGVGTERGTTDAGIDVRNVALPVIEEPYRVYELA